MEARGWKLIGWKLERQGACKRPTWRTERRRINFRIHSGGRYSAPQKVWHLWSRFFSCCLFIYSGSSSAGPGSIENALIFFTFFFFLFSFGYPISEIASSPFVIVNLAAQLFCVVEGRDETEDASPITFSLFHRPIITYSPFMAL
jgi:hypothetical protein